MSADDLKRYETELLAGPALDVIDRECFGRFGYGDGRVISGQAETPIGAPQQGPDDRPAFMIAGGCTACERRDACWPATRAKAAELLPELAAEEEEIARDGHVGVAFLREWKRRTGQQQGDSMIPPPSMLLNTINLKAGAAHTVRLVTGELPRRDAPPDG